MQTQMYSNSLASTAQSSQASYTEMADLAKLRLQSKRDPGDAMQKVARQFEGLFLKMMLKSMRQASFGNPLFDSSQTELYQDMFDNQIALNMANGKGIGLADALMKQLSHFTGQPDAAEQAAGSADKLPPATMLPLTRKADTEVAETKTQANQVVSFGSLPVMDLLRSIPAGNTEPVKTARLKAVPPGKGVPGYFATPESFVRKMWPMAKDAAAELGVTPQVLIAQAALETGWGKAVSRDENGRSSHNLFNIKADQRWSGNTVSKPTLEFEGGVAKRQLASFRAYDNYADSFRDYVQFLKSNPRYRGALDAASEADQFISGLQRAGYATDPQYADKIMDILKRESMRTPVMQKQEQLNG